MDLVTGFGLIGVTVIVSGLVAGLVDRGPISFPIIFLGIGLGLGATGVLDVDVHDPSLEVVAALTLSLVLFMDAFSLEGGGSRKDWLVPALVLGPGTVIVILIVAGAAILLLDMRPITAFLLGAVLSSTDAVVLRDVVRDDRVPRPVRRVLSVEAGTNDIIILPLLLVLIAIASGEGAGSGPGDWALFGLEVFVIGPATGGAIGAVGAWLMAKADARYSVRREYQALYGVGLVLSSYAAAVALGGDGFLAAFFAGLAITALDQTLCDCFLEFGEAAAEISMLLAFVLFGALLATELGSVPLAAGLGLAAIVIFMARPLAIGLVLSIRPAALSRAAAGVHRLVRSPGPELDAVCPPGGGRRAFRTASFSWRSPGWWSWSRWSSTAPAPPRSPPGTAARLQARSWPRSGSELPPACSSNGMRRTYPSGSARPGWRR